MGVPIHAFYLAVLVVLLLSCGSLVQHILQRRHPAHDYTELKQRIQSWWLMVLILFAALLFNQTLAIIFFALLSFLALKEFLSVVSTRQADRRVIFWAYLAIPVQYYWVATGWYGMFIIFIPVYVFLLLPVRLVLLGQPSGFIRSAGILHWATMLTVFCLSHIAYLLVLPVKNDMAGYIGPVLFLLFMTQFNDVCQYIWGKLLGRKKILPRVSPNKTWEGFLGGLLTITLLASLVGPYLTPLNGWQGMMAGALIALSGFFGDVVISSVKRDLQIKDTGNLIPGHGGILDRLDSLIFTAPVFFHFLYYSHY